MIQSLTDNKNRTVGEIRHLLAAYNGNLAAENSVAWMFTRKGQVIVEKARPTRNNSSTPRSMPAR